MKKTYKTYDFFVGKISPFLLFEMEYHSLSYVVEKLREDKDKFYVEVNPASHISSIGLLAYFEAFCKHQFAACINLFPSLLQDFSKKRNDTNIQLSSIISLNGEFEKNIGFVLAENFDFGTTKSINKIFNDLLLVTPFNKKDEQTFSNIVYKRNLILHHAGYYTLNYFKKEKNLEEIKQKLFIDELKIDTKEYYVISDFLFEMALKITQTTVKALKNRDEYKLLEITDSRIDAVNELLRGIYDMLE